MMWICQGKNTISNQFRARLLYLNDIMDEVDIGEHGVAYIVNKNGLTIAHTDESIAGVDNTIN